MATQSFQLVMSSGPTPNEVYPLSKQEIIIGRDTNADIVINIAEISRRHTRFRFEGGGFLVEDLGSTNGTFVNGQRLTGPHMMRPGDRVKLGEAVTLAYQVAQYDMNATVVTPSSQKDTLTPGQPMSPVQRQAAPAAVPPPVQRAAPPPRPPQQGYAGQIPQAPPMAPSVPEKEGRPWLWAGLGCVGVSICLFVVGAVAFDMMNLYCSPPFNTLFSFLYTCQ